MAFFFFFFLCKSLLENTCLAFWEGFSNSFAKTSCFQEGWFELQRAPAVVWFHIIRHTSGSLPIVVWLIISPTHTNLIFSHTLRSHIAPIGRDHNAGAKRVHSSLAWKTRCPNSPLTSCFWTGDVSERHDSRATVGEKNNWHPREALYENLRSLQAHWLKQARQTEC